MNCTVVVPAAGSGSRFGGDVPKQFLPIAGRPVLAHTLSRLEQCPLVGEIVVAVAPDALERFDVIRSEVGLTKTRTVEGGSTRSESVLLALRSLIGSTDESIVAVHDAVRPFASRHLLESLINAMEGCDGAFPGLPLTDTIHRIENGFVVETPDRGSLAGAQTPQCFRLGVIRHALEQVMARELVATDEVAAVVRLGYRVAAIPGEPDNIKITYPEDFERAERILAREGV